MTNTRKYAYVKTSKVEMHEGENVRLFNKVLTLVLQMVNLVKKSDAKKSLK